jgi:DNA-binding GntR family transcriptional regulator
VIRVASDGKEDVSAHTLASRLAAQIIERSRQMGMAPGAHLTEQELADAFRVSRTPVRMALRVLQDMQLVENRPNRGFFLTQKVGDAANDGGMQPAREGADEDPLYFQIAEDRLTGVLGERCTEAELARRYGASRARVVRLLARMAQEGWIERLPGHGWSFQAALTSREAYDQGYRYRMLIEPAALREPGYHLTPEVIAETRAQQQAMLAGGIQHWSRSETFAANANFHEVIVGGSSNPFLLSGLRRVNRLRRLHEYRTLLQHRSRLVHECEDHLRMLDLIAAGDHEAAAVTLYTHLDRSRQAKARIMCAESAKRPA